MHAPSLLKYHVFSQNITWIAHHKMAAILVALTLLEIGYVLSFLPERWVLPQQAALSDTSARADEIGRPLSRLDDPEYVHESPLRVQYIYESLKWLRDVIQADRTYVVVYGYSSRRFGRGIEPKIANTFEIGELGPGPQIKDFQGFSRMDWLQAKRAERTLSGPFPGNRRNHGMELVDGRGTSIGYLGIDYWQKHPAFEGNFIPLLQESARIVQDILLQPLKALSPDTVNSSGTKNEE